MSSFKKYGVTIAGTGKAVPEQRLTNKDLEKILDTSDEWIVQRTGIKERRICNRENGESAFTIQRDALAKALSSANMKGSDLDLVIVASVSSEMACPSNACRVAAAVEATPAGAFDLVAACSGFVYALNLADTLIKSGQYRAIGIVGGEEMSRVMDYRDRRVSVLFGDAASSAILVRSNDITKGSIDHTMGADGTNWNQLYIPRDEYDLVDGEDPDEVKIGCLRMKGSEVYKFAVKQFQSVIKESLLKNNLCVDDIDQFVCHQSNIRIIDSACERLGLPGEKVLVNLPKYGNTSAASVGLVLDDLWISRKIDEGMLLFFVAFGGGMTWATNIWRV